MLNMKAIGQIQYNFFVPGYTNDPEYYQLPNQNLLEDQTKVRPAPRLRREFSTEVFKKIILNL